MMKFVYWILFATNGALMALSFIKGKIHLVKYSFMLLILNNVLRLLNLEGFTPSENTDISL